MFDLVQFFCVPFSNAPAHIPTKVQGGENLEPKCKYIFCILYSPCISPLCYIVCTQKSILEHACMHTGDRSRYEFHL